MHLLRGHSGSGGGGRNNREDNLVEVVAGEAVGEVDLRSHGVGEVGDHEDILDVRVEHALDVGAVDFRSERDGVEEELANGGRSLGFAGLEGGVSRGGQ